MRFVPVPGYGLPGRDIPLLDRDANLVAWLDRKIFPASHLYEHTRDPEGLISTLSGHRHNSLRRSRWDVVVYTTRIDHESHGNRHSWR